MGLHTCRSETDRPTLFQRLQRSARIEDDFPADGFAGWICWGKTEFLNIGRIGDAKSAIALWLKHRAFGIGVANVTSVFDGFETGEFETARGICFGVRPSLILSLGRVLLRHQANLGVRDRLVGRDVDQVSAGGESTRENNLDLLF